MKLPDLIKQAVAEGDWKKVCAVYTAITGEPLAPPVPKKKELDLANFEITPELLQAIMGDDAPDEVFGDDPSHIEANEEETSQRAHLENPTAPVISKPVGSGKKKDPNDFSVAKRVQRNQEGKQAARKEPMNIPRQRTNKFEDTLALETKDLQSNNPKLAAMYGDASRRVLRDENESTGNEIDVKCSLCERQETVATSLAVGWHPSDDENTYRCNSCNTPSGRRKAERAIREREGVR